MKKDLSVISQTHIILREVLKEEESKLLEFKSSMLYDKNKKCINNHLSLDVIKSIASFLNSEGGTLYVGISPDRDIIGLENDFSLLTKDKNFDGWQQYLSNLIRNHLGNLTFKSIITSPVQDDNKTIAKITIQKHFLPVYLKSTDENRQQKEEFYIRGLNAKQLLSQSEATQYILNHWD
jgi:predicted HTH transcriptional regulator